MSTGVLKFFNPKKGYGFIAPDNGARDVFVHVSAIEEAGLKFGADEGRGTRLYYEVEADQKSGKPKAVRLRLRG